MGKPRTRRYKGKTYRLYKEGATYGRFSIGDEAKEIAKKLRAKGFSVRIEHNIWGNTRIWVRRRLGK